MKAFRDFGLSKKLLITTGGFMALLLVMLTIISVENERKVLLRELESLGRVLTQEMAHDAPLALLTKNLTMAERRISSTLRVHPVEKLALYHADGSLFVGRGYEGAPFSPPAFESAKEEVVQALAEGGILESIAPVYAQDISSAREGLGMAEDVLSPQPERRWIVGYARVGLSTADLGPRVKTFALKMLAVLFVVIIIMWTVLMVILGRYVEPIVLLAENAGKVTRGNLDVKIEVDSKDEVGRLAEAFNEMISSLKVHIDEVRERAQEIEDLAEGAMDGIFLLDEAFKIVRTNREMARILGYARSELLGRDMREITVQGIGAEAFRETREGFMQTREIRCRTKGGEEIPFELNLTEVTHDGLPALLGFARDVRERKRMEEHLLQNEKMAAMGRLAASLAHEVNNPLGIIKNYLEMVRRKLNASDAEQMENIKVIQDEISRVAEIIRGLLSFSKREQDAGEWTEINRHIAETVRLVEPLARKKNIAFGLDFGDALRPIPVSAGHVKQVLLNLINNAMDAMPTGGKVRISTIGRKDGVLLAVEDNGPGVDEKVLPELFTPFFTTKGVKGTGLGLSITYGIVRGYGGRVRLENRKEGGARAEVLFPYASTEREGEAA